MTRNDSGRSSDNCWEWWVCLTSINCFCLHLFHNPPFHSPHLCFYLSASLLTLAIIVSLSLQGSVWVNNRSRIVKSDYTTFNGVIHHIDTMLTPYRLQDKPSVKSNTVRWVWLKWINDLWSIRLERQAVWPLSLSLSLRWTLHQQLRFMATPISTNS